MLRKQTIMLQKKVAAMETKLSEGPGGDAGSTG